MKEIYELNRDIMGHFKKLFEDRGIPVIPSLGNNDIYRKPYASLDGLRGGTVCNTDLPDHGLYSTQHYCEHTRLGNKRCRTLNAFLRILQRPGPNSITAEFAK